MKKQIFIAVLSIGLLAVGATAFASTIGTPYIWITNYGGNTISKLDTSKGNVVGTYPAGIKPWGVAVDANGNIWVTHDHSSTVSLFSSNGSLIKNIFMKEIVGADPLLLLLMPITMLG